MSEPLFPPGGIQTPLEQTLVVIMPLLQAESLGDERVTDRIAYRMAR